MKPRQFTQLRVNFLLCSGGCDRREEKKKEEEGKKKEEMKKKKRGVFVSPDACANIKQRRGGRRRINAFITVVGKQCRSINKPAAL